MFPNLKNWFGSGAFDQWTVWNFRLTVTEHFLDRVSGITVSRWNYSKSEQRVHVFSRLGNSLVLVWLSQQKRECFPKPVLTFGCNKMRTSFQVLGPPTFKYLPSGVNLALRRTTRLHSSTNQSEMCKTLQLLWIWIRYSGQSLTDAEQIRHGNLFARSFCQRIINCQKRKKSCAIRVFN